MIRIERPDIDLVLDEATRHALKARKAKSSSLDPKSSRITSRWDSFVGGKGKDKGVGPRVCEAIKKYCRKKCAYCEATSAPTIDHFWPKSDYPSKMFDWENLLAACRDCNSEKRKEFLLDGKGEPVLVDPTSEEPLHHFRWDHQTGKCLYLKTDVRADETARNIDMDRHHGERHHKLENVRYLFARCIDEKPISTALRDLLRAELDASSPYLCILRSYLLYPVHPKDLALIRESIRALPEIVDWVRPWLLPPPGTAWPP